MAGNTNLSITGNGASVVGGGGSFAGILRSFGEIKQSGGSIDDSVLATENVRSKIPQDLYDGGTVDVEIVFIADTLPPMHVPDLWTFTLPSRSEDPGPSFSGSAFVTARSFSGAANGQLCIGKFTLEFDGKETLPAMS